MKGHADLFRTFVHDLVEGRQAAGKQEDAITTQRPRVGEWSVTY